MAADALPTSSALPPNPVSTARTRFASIFFAVAAVGWVVHFILLVIVVNVAGDSFGTLVVAALLVGLLMKTPYALLVVTMSDALGLSNPTPLTMLTFLPFGHWVVLVRALNSAPPGYVEPLTVAGQLPTQPPRWLALMGVAPLIFACLIAALLFAVRSDYMMQLVAGPEQGGAYMPGLPIPFGWFVLSIGCIPPAILYAEGIGLLWLLSRPIQYPRPGWIAVMGVIVAFWQYLSIACFLQTYVTILGPAAVQLYESFIP